MHIGSFALVSPFSTLDDQLAQISEIAASMATQRWRSPERKPFARVVMICFLFDRNHLPQSFHQVLAENPENPAIRRLLDVCYESHLAVHRAVSGAGAHFTSLGDSFCGPDVVSPSMFEEFSRPYEERLVRQLAEEGISFSTPAMPSRGARHRRTSARLLRQPQNLANTESG